MEAAGKPNLAEEIAGALAWWREAGVDCDFTAEPQSWLAKAPEPEAAPAPAAVAKPAVVAPPPRALPATLAEFTAWWLADPSLDPGHPADRIAPRGEAGARVMVLVASPEGEDRDRLLSGPQGRLLEAMLGALGWAEEAYVASVLPRHDPMPDWPAVAAAGLGAIALHHVSLVAPERVLVLGSNVSSLLGHDATRKPQFLPHVNHDGRTFPVLAEMDLAALLAQPRLKAGLWGRLLDWTGS
jgi:uracil-DNA glycosylase